MSRTRALGGALALTMLFALVGASPAGAVDTDAFCAAYEKLQLDPTNNKVIAAQAARMSKAKPPRDVAKALGVIKAAASGAISATDQRVSKATSTLSTYVSDACSASGASDSAGSATAPTSRCPITAAQASSAVGTQLVAQGSCTFFPANGDVWPSVIFVRQVAFACSGSIPSEVGYTERLDGLGVKAYVQRDAGASILVCDKLPFEITIDIVGDSAASLAAAQQLAALVLKG